MGKNEELILLLKRIKKGDMEAFTPFYEMTKRYVFYSALSVIKDHGLAEDLLQDTYCRILDNLDSIDIDKFGISYLTTISRNLALNRLERDSKLTDLEENIHQTSTHYQVETQIDYEQTINLMRKILNSEEFEIVILHLMEDMTHQEIANRMNLPLGTVTWRYNNALAKLKKGLEIK